MRSIRFSKNVVASHRRRIWVDGRTFVIRLEIHVAKRGMAADLTSDRIGRGVDRRLASGHEVGEHACRPHRQGPAEVAVAAVHPQSTRSGRPDIGPPVARVSGVAIPGWIALIKAVRLSSRSRSRCRFRPTPITTDIWRIEQTLFSAVSGILTFAADGRSLQLDFGRPRHVRFAKG